MLKEKNHLILDACCGGRLFWFNKNHPNTIYSDIRSEEFLACDGRKVKVRPDQIADFRNLPFEGNSFKLVVLDPPHDMYAGLNSFTFQKYGKLDKDNWQSDLKKGFDECMRVLDLYGILIFKWNETRVKVSQIIEIVGQQPLIGHKSGKSSKIHWMTFMKMPHVPDQPTAKTQ